MAGKILIVDDVASNRIILKAKLAVYCHDVIQASDGVQALSVARTARPDLILLELAMPGMNGLDVCRQLKDDPETSRIPVVVITAHADTRSKIAALRAGAEDFLTKPVDDMVLYARVRSLLRARVLEEELELHEGTRRALGFSDAQAGYATGNASVSLHAAPAEIAVIGGAGSQLETLTAAISEHLPHRIVQLDRAEALRRVREASLARSPEDVDSRLRARRAPADGGLGERPAGVFRTMAAEGPGAEQPAHGRPEGVAEATADVPEVFVVSADIETPGDGLLLLAELRANPSTRHSAILMALPRDARATAPMALDLGASDLLLSPLEAEEVALRISTQLARSRAATFARRRLRAGLQMAVVDPLTGLYNRRYGLSHLDRVIARAVARSRGFALMALDLDRFKDVNDRYGHAAGDCVLQTVARRLEASLRPQDLVARIGGEEFLAILPDIGSEDAQRAAERLRRAVRETPVHLTRLGASAAEGAAAWNGHADEEAGSRAGDGTMDARDTGALSPEIWQTISIGLVFVPGSGPMEDPPDGSRKDADGLLRRADRALYAAKAAGRDRVAGAEARPGEHRRGGTAAA